MKKTILMAAIAALVLTSCGSSRNVTYAPAPVQEQQQKVSYGTERQEEVKDPWYELQAQATNHLRGAGDAVSTIKAVATQMAITQATSNLAASIEQAASLARRMTIQAMGLNDKSEASVKFSEDMKIKAAGIVSMNKPLMTKTYQLKNGQYQVGHCFELVMTIDQLKQELQNTIKEDVMKSVGDVMTEDQRKTVEAHTANAIEAVNF